MLRRGGFVAAAMIYFVIALPADGAENEPQPADAKGIEFFERHVRPVLVERCHKCHSAKSDPLRGGLLLDSRPAWQRGGDSERIKR